MNKEVGFALVFSFSLLLYEGVSLVEVRAYISYPVHNLNTGLDYDTIQNAINANETQDWQTILVDAGTYYENIVVNKTVWLIGQSEDAAIIDGQGIGDVVTINANSANIRGFAIRNSGQRSLDSGILLNYSNYATISDDSVMNCGYGIRILSSNYSNIAFNSINNNSLGIGFSVALGSPEMYSFGALLTHNRITDNYRGILLSEVSNATVFENELENNRYSGINIRYSSNNAVARNNIIGNEQYGIELVGCSSNTVRENLIQNSSSNPDSAGISFVDSYNNTLIDNSLVNNACGLWMLDSGGNIIIHNNLVNNTFEARAWHTWPGIPLMNTWDDGYPSGGNYWSNYEASYPNATEIDSLSLWNTPYRITSNNIDRYPLKSPIIIPEFFSSPVLMLFTIATAASIMACRRKRLNAAS